MNGRRQKAPLLRYTELSPERFQIVLSGLREGGRPGTAIRTARGFDVIQEEGQPSRLFAVEEYGVNIMRALPTFVVAALMATTGWTSTHAAERVDLLLVLAADVSGSMDEFKIRAAAFGIRGGFLQPSSD